MLAPGRRADINPIDLERLRLHYPERVEDLPGGAGRLIQRSDGYVETLVLRQTVVADGELTDARPGGLVRGPGPRVSSGSAKRRRRHHADAAAMLPRAPFRAVRRRK